MLDTGKTRDSGILDLIRILSTNGATGRLDISAGATEGMVFFKDGQLVDARVGHLRGFPAVNAVASIRDARFNFDATAVPPLVSSITASERVVLKQFFGIETVEAKAAPEDDVTIETHRIPVEAIPTPMPEVVPSRSLYRGALVLALLFIVIAVAAVALRNKYRERAVAPSVATTEQPPSTTEQPAPTTDQPASNDLPAPVDQPVAAQDLSGKWTVVNTVQKTSYRSYQDMKIGFDLSLSQNGKSITGKGQKVSENGRTLPADSQTPIEVKGSINGNRVEATFFEEGTTRKTNGRFVWRIDETGGLTGTFFSTAANTSGKSAARKEL
ncbi:MAG TPA: DUF4388 domain-containing protein [Pyrinomonadaceae bacterium]|nr:DUF4388 domain-containing protein [Pyrinomonadaceae bacterium]